MVKQKPPTPRSPILIRTKDTSHLKSLLYKCIGHDRKPGDAYLAATQSVKPVLDDRNQSNLVLIRLPPLPKPTDIP
jgi:hypothetical protein